MEKLRELTKTELNAKYYDEFGLPAEHQDRGTILAALFYGKRIKYLTQYEIDTINEQ